MMTEREKMVTGELYSPADPELRRMFRRAKELTRLYNETGPDDSDARQAYLRDLLGAMGEDVYIEPPFRCDYGENITVGDRFYANYDCIIIDVCPVTIGRRVLLGPRVCLCTATHPLDAGTRAGGLELGRPITIGDDVWLGGQVFVNPGVTIGNGAVVGSGSVVTRDIPAGVVAAGNPCRVLRPLTEADRQARRRAGLED